VTKVVLLAPKDIDILSQQIGVFLVMCWVIFGTNSDIVKELTGLVDHILANETTYQHLQAADSIFTTKQACYLDC
jgi:hypothetical protein